MRFGEDFGFRMVDFGFSHKTIINVMLNLFQHPIMLTSVQVFSIPIACRVRCRNKFGTTGGFVNSAFLCIRPGSVGEWEWLMVLVAISEP